MFTRSEHNGRQVFVALLLRLRCCKKLLEVLPEVYSLRTLVSNCYWSCDEDQIDFS